MRHPRRTFLSTAAAVLATTASSLAGSSESKAVVHIVLFKFLPTTTQASVDQLMAQASALSKEIPGILDVVHGRNFSPRSPGYSHAITMRFRNRAALEAFYVHPAHLRLVNTSIKPIAAELLPIDYEVQ